MATATEPAARTATPKNRLIGPMPRIGIRPAIDGRMKGVRESLEGQTLTMARSVADLLQAKLRHSNGLPVECVIPTRCIGGVAESAETAALFEREGVGLTLTVTPAWCYGAETMDMNPLYPKAVWGFNGTERPGAVYLAAVLAGHTQKGLPAFGIYGRDVQDAGDTTIPPDVEEKLLRFARAGVAVATMRGKSYLSLGGTSMGIAGSQVDPAFLEGYLGLRVEPVDMTEVARRINEEIYDADEYARAAVWVKEHCPEGRDHNPPSHERTREQKDADWGEVRITEPGRDVVVTRVETVQLQIEAAAGSPLTTVEWFTSVNGGEETLHELPAPEEAQYAVYDPVIGARPPAATFTGLVWRNKNREIPCRHGSFVSTYEDD